MGWVLGGQDVPGSVSLLAGLWVWGKVVIGPWGGWCSPLCGVQKLKVHVIWTHGSSSWGPGDTVGRGGWRERHAFGPGWESESSLAGRLGVGGGMAQDRGWPQGFWAPCVESGLYSEGSGRLLPGPLLGPSRFSCLAHPAPPLTLPHLLPHSPRFVHPCS